MRLSQTRKRKSLRNQRKPHPLNAKVTKINQEDLDHHLPADIDLVQAEEEIHTDITVLAAREGLDQETEQRKDTTDLQIDATKMRIDINIAAVRRADMIVMMTGIETDTQTETDTGKKTGIRMADTRMIEMIEKGTREAQSQMSQIGKSKRQMRCGQG